MSLNDDKNLQQVDDVIDVFKADEAEELQYTQGSLVENASKIGQRDTAIKDVLVSVSDIFKCIFDLVSPIFSLLNKSKR